MRIESLNDVDLESVAGGFCATPVPAPTCGTPPRLGPLPMPLPKPLPGFPPRPPVCPAPPPFQPHPWGPPAPRPGVPGVRPPNDTASVEF
jgi:hypothetical protein